MHQKKVLLAGLISSADITEFSLALAGLRPKPFELVLEYVLRTQSNGFVRSRLRLDESKMDFVD
jgi:hypothetical protein